MATGGDGREAPEAEGGAAAPPAAPLRPAPALEGASVVSRLLFTWAYPLLKLGRTRPLLESDLPALLEADTSAYNRRYFEELWEGEKERTRARTGRWKGPASAAVPAAAPPLIPRLDRAVFVDYFRQTWDAQAWLVLSMAARLGQSLSLGLLIEQFSAGSDARMGYAWAGCLVGTGLVFLVAKQSQFFATIRKGMTMRLGLLAAIYSKSLRLGASSIPSGRVVNLASNDVERYQTASALVVYFIYAPLEAAVVLAVGITVVGGAFAAGFGLLLLFLPVQFHLARRFASLRSGTATVTDGRVGLVGQAVQGCRVMKMHGWEGSFGERIAEVRAQEMGRIVAASRYRSINEAIQFSYAAVVAAVTFSVHVWAGGGAYFPHGLHGLLAHLHPADEPRQDLLPERHVPERVLRLVAKDPDLPGDARASPARASFGNWEGGGWGWERGTGAAHHSFRRDMLLELVERDGELLFHRSDSGSRDRRVFSR